MVQILRALIALSFFSSVASADLACILGNNTTVAGKMQITLTPATVVNTLPSLHVVFSNYGNDMANFQMDYQNCLIGGQNQAVVYCGFDKTKNQVTGPVFHSILSNDSSFSLDSATLQQTQNLTVQAWKDNQQITNHLFNFANCSGQLLGPTAPTP